MPTDSLVVKVRAPAAAVAGLIGQFDLVADLSPQIAACEVEGEGVGATRALTMSDGLQVLERLVEESETGYAYELVDGPEAIEGYRIAIVVNPDGPDASTVRWTLELRVVEGHDPEPTVRSLRAVAELAFESASRQLEGARERSRSFSEP